MAYQNHNLTNGCTGQISAVTFCAKTRTKTAIKNLLGEPGVMHQYEVKNKLMKKILILVVSSTLFGCVAPYQQPTVGKVTSDPDCPDYSEVSAGFYGGNGSNEEQAIEMVGVDYSPYRWIEENYPGSKPTMQALIHSPRTGLKYDLIKFQTPDGNEKSAYFWISGGFHCFLKNSGK